MLEKLLLRRPALRRIPTQELPVPEPERTPSAYEQMLARAYRAGAPLLPVAVARQKGGWRLLCGMERLAAARSAGAARVPALVVRGGLEGALFSLLLGWQPEGRDPFRRAALLEDCLGYLEKRELGELLGMSPTAITQRLRLLQLGEELRRQAVSRGMQESQLLELLRLPAALRMEGLQQLLEAEVSPADTRRFLQEKLASDTLKTGRRRRLVVKDGRIFQNTIRRSVELMQEAGLEATWQRELGEGFVEYRIRVPEAQLISGRRA